MLANTQLHHRLNNSLQRGPLPVRLPSQHHVRGCQTAQQSHLFNHAEGSKRSSTTRLVASSSANGATHAPSSSATPPAKQQEASHTSSTSREGASSTSYVATLLLQCPDQKVGHAPPTALLPQSCQLLRSWLPLPAQGVIAAVSQLLYGFQCNIISSDQFTDGSSNTFFQRISFEYQGRPDASTRFWFWFHFRMMED